MAMFIYINLAKLYVALKKLSQFHDQTDPYW